LSMRGIGAAPGPREGILGGVGRTHQLGHHSTRKALELAISKVSLRVTEETTAGTS
jgi:hypothetical protein